MSSSSDRLPALAQQEDTAETEGAASSDRLPPSLDAIYESHVDFVWSSARRLGVSEANIDDVVQDVFLVVYRRIAEYDDRASMRGWMFGILRRVVSDHRRRFRRKDARCIPHEHDSSNDVKVESRTPSPVELAERSERVKLLDKLLDELDPDKREVLVLSEFEQLTLREIAVAVGANINTVYSRLRAAKRDFESAYARWLAGKEGGT